MKPITRDICLTLLIKFFLLFLLWWFCVRTMHPVLKEKQDWLLGPQQHSVSQVNKPVSDESTMVHQAFEMNTSINTR